MKTIKAFLPLKYDTSQFEYIFSGGDNIMKQNKVIRCLLSITTIILLSSGTAYCADWPNQGSTNYVTHFMQHPIKTITLGDEGKTIALEMVGTTANLNGEKLMDKMTANCVAIQTILKTKNFIEGSCVLADKDGDKIFSTFDTREITLTLENDKSEGAIYKYTCGTHIIIGGSGKYKDMTGKEPFNCYVLPTAAGGGWSGVDIDHQLNYKFE